MIGDRKPNAVYGDPSAFARALLGEQEMEQQAPQKRRRGRPAGSGKKPEEIAMLTDAARIDEKKTCADCGHYDADYEGCKKFDIEVDPIRVECLHFENKIPAAAGTAKKEDKENQCITENGIPAAQEFEDSVTDEMAGMVKMAETFSEFTGVVALLKLQQIKEHKLYKKYGTWADFCKRLNKSEKTVDEQLSNLALLGEQAFKKLQQIGATRRDIRRLRAVPGEEQKLIVQEIEANVGDRDSLLELIEELGEKHRKERDALRDEIKQADANANKLKREQKAADKVAADLTQRNKELHAKIELYQSRKLDDVLKRNLSELSGLIHGMTAGENSVQDLRIWLTKLWAFYDERDKEMPPKQIRQQAAQDINRVIADLRYLLVEFGLHADEDDVMTAAGEQWSPGMGGVYVEGDEEGEEA